MQSLRESPPAYIYQHYQPLSFHTKWIPISKRFVWFKGYPSCLSTPITPPHSCTFTTQGRPSLQLQYPLHLYGFSYRRLTFACHSNHCNSVVCFVSIVNTSQFVTLIYEYSGLIYFTQGKGTVTLICPVNRFNSSKSILMWINLSDCQSHASPTCIVIPLFSHRIDWFFLSLRQPVC